MKTRCRHDLDFLPAAMELQETPPAPLGVLIVWAVILFFGLALLWAGFGRVNVVAVAEGRTIPAGRVKVIQPLESGVVRRIRVTEGQPVAVGDSLVELDTTLVEADRARVAEELLAGRLEITRLEVLVQVLSDSTAPSFTTPRQATAEQVKMLHYQIDQSILEHRAHIARSVFEQRQYSADLSATRARIARLDATLPLITEHTEAVGRLVESNLAPRVQWLALERDRVEQVKERDVQRSLAKSIEARIQTVEQARAVYTAGYQTQLLEALSRARLRVAALEEQEVKVLRRRSLHNLTAPVAGVVQELAIHTIGGVVTPAQTLMVIVPLEEPLMVEAWVENKDIGFVNEGQSAEVKVEAFPFTKYGVIAGKVTSVSHDSIYDSRRGARFAALVRMGKHSLSVEGQQIVLSSGMAVSVEVKTGERRLIEFVLSPVLRALRESARER